MTGANAETSRVGLCRAARHTPALWCILGLMTLEPTPGTAIDRARRAAEEALAGSTTDPKLKAARDAAKADLGEVPAPARMTRAFSYVLDDFIQVPGTKVRVGVDPLLSLVPWAGTAVGAVFGGVVLVDAIRLRAPVPVVARMVGNSILDWLLGMVPFLGAFADVAFRANKKNLKLLNRTIENRDLVKKASLQYLIAVGALVVLVIAAMIAIPVAILLGLDALVRR